MMDETVAAHPQRRTDGIVLIDYPGFKSASREAAARGGLPRQADLLHQPPGLGWKKGRIRLMAELLDLMVCIFPFEKELYESSGLKTVFAGHPSSIPSPPLKARGLSREENLVALLPVRASGRSPALYPAMLEAAAILTNRHPGLRFATSGATPR